MGLGTQLCTLLEVWVLEVGMSTLDAQTSLYSEDRGIQVPMPLEHDSIVGTQCCDNTVPCLVRPDPRVSQRILPFRYVQIYWNGPHCVSRVDNKTNKPMTLDHDKIVGTRFCDTVPRLVRPDPRVRQRIYTSLDTFRSRRMDHTVFHKWLIKQTKKRDWHPCMVESGYSRQEDPFRRDPFTSNNRRVRIWPLGRIQFLWLWNLHLSSSSVPLSSGY